MRRRKVQPEFVEFIPETLEEGVLYISVPFATASHKCMCGCGELVVTPIRPTDWRLTWNGEAVSLHPSIGNWSFACQSHYWISENRVIWTTAWSSDRIDAGRRRDLQRKVRYYARRAGGVSLLVPEQDWSTSRDGIRPGFHDGLWMRSCHKRAFSPASCHTLTSMTTPPPSRSTGLRSLSPPREGRCGEWP